MTPFFRLARPDDLPALLTLYGDLSPGDPLPEGEVAERIWSEMLAPGNLSVIATELDGEVVATAMLILVPNLTRGGRAFAVIENVVTRADLRGRGIGRAMLHHMLERAWEAGCYKVMLATGRTDEAVLGFYERTGFTRNPKTFFEARP